MQILNIFTSTLPTSLSDIYTQFLEYISIISEPLTTINENKTISCYLIAMKQCFTQPHSQQYSLVQLFDDYCHEIESNITLTDTTDLTNRLAKLAYDAFDSSGGFLA